MRTFEMKKKKKTKKERNKKQHPGTKLETSEIKTGLEGRAQKTRPVQKRCLHSGLFAVNSLQSANSWL